MYNEVIHFWFNELTPSDWFIDSIHIDQIIIERFGSLHKQAVQGELYEWRFSSQGGLAAIIILDQFSRNIHRGHSKSFDNDGMALVLAQNMIEKQQDKQLIPNMKAFCYLPFMHSESQIIHKNALELYNQVGLEQYLEYELKHKVIIDKFGRYPHRNPILGRFSTQEELDFLKTSF